jgi:hypothetical protein
MMIRPPGRVDLTRRRAADGSSDPIGTISSCLIR